MFSNLFSSFSADALKADLVLRSVKIVHFCEGQIEAIYEKVSDKETYADLCEHLDKIREIDNYSVNPDTGSIVINYDPAKILPKTFLGHLVEGARKKYSGEI